MSAWAPDELDRIGVAEELDLTAKRRDGTSRKPVTIWVVRVGDDLYVRSWRGSGAGWYRAVMARPEARVSAGGVQRDVGLLARGAELNDAIDDAYLAKYGRYPSYVEPMVTADARATTLQLVPRAGDGR
jgi:hypothetical protein